jgi:mono/diheme cytochrome c family protein
MRRLVWIVALTAVIYTFGCRVAPNEHRAGALHVPAGPDSAATDSAAAKVVAILPLPDLGYNAREGRVLYRHYCLNCHGDSGAGDGFNAYNLDPHPRALTDSIFQASHSDEDLVAAIRSGGGAVGLSNEMPPWGRTLNERKIHNIVDYLRSLRSAAEKPH